MNSQDVLKYGDEAFMHALKNLPDSSLENGLVNTEWNVRDVIGHIAAYEIVFVEVLKKTLDPAADTPLLDAAKDKNYDFNQVESSKRKNQPYLEVLKEYKDAHAQVMDLINKFSPKQLAQQEILKWYGLDYSIEDYIVYRNYGHKRHHAAQIEDFRRTNNL